MNITTEWLDGTGINSPALAASWCRLALGIGKVTLTRCELGDDAASGVYGSAFPLASWVVSNWWFVLNEPSVGECPSSPRSVRTRREADWLERHNLLHARDGQTLPDVSIYRDGPWVCFRAIPDPPEGVLGRVARFTTGGEFRLPFERVEHSLHLFVTRTLDRIRQGGANDDADAARLGTDWGAVLDSMEREPDLCRRLALLGVDPYGEEDELPDKLLADMRTLDTLPESLAEDVLGVSTVQNIASGAQVVERELGAHRLVRDHPPPPVGEEASAHRQGYRLAMSLREGSDLGIAPVRLESVLHDCLGWPGDFDQRPVGPFPDKQFRGLVGQTDTGDVRVIRIPKGRANSDRFAIARAAYFALHSEGGFSPRVVTGSYSWDQKASRAFAAELLAPSEAIRSRVDLTVDQERLLELSEEFEVSDMVIRHQIENHGLAVVLGD